MRAVTIVPRTPGSLRLAEVDEPVLRAGEVLVKTAAIGICGTDRELIDGHYGESPPGDERLVIGHESLGEVLEASPGSGFARGERVVGIVRHPDPAPCLNCAVGEWDMCRNGRYTERGIKARDGFASELFAVEKDFLVRVDPALGLAAVLLEPATVAAKAWEHIERIGARARWAPGKVLVTGAGPVGLLAAMMGVQRGLEVHLEDRNREGVKPTLARALGAKYSAGEARDEYDVVLECTGAPAVIRRVLERESPNRIVCLLGLSPAGSDEALPVAPFNQGWVLGNQVVFGSVNANRRHYEAAARSLAAADKAWLERLLTRQVPLERWNEAYEKRPGEVKTVLRFGD
jgi:threonine dehydrogenase-like Zn-dependent dehydrogenase